MQRNRCGTPEREVSPGSEARWPQGVVTYYEDLVFAGMSRAAIAACYDAACARWTAVCGLRFVRVSDPAQANIVAHTGPIDGPYNILAESDLPYGATAASQMSQLYDDSEPWNAEGTDILIACICHEVGHAIGLEHIPGVGALMDPIIHPGTSSPRPPDIAEADLRYGPPSPSEPGPTPGPYELLGAAFAPYVVGPFCDGLVASAIALDGGASTIVAKMDGIAAESVKRAGAWNKLVEPKLDVLDSKARAAALRSIARGMAGVLGLG